MPVVSDQKDKKEKIFYLEKKQKARVVQKRKSSLISLFLSLSLSLSFFLFLFLVFEEKP